MKSYETVINLMKIEKIGYKKPLDRDNLIYSDNIVNDLKEIKKCNSLEDFNSLENEYMMQIRLINNNLDYYFNKSDISNNLFEYSKEMYDFYMSTEAANVLEKMIYAFKIFVEKMISLAIKLFRLICIKIAEFKAFLQNGLYKKFNKDDLVHTNIRIKAIPINENMAEIDKFLDEVYRKNYIIGRLFAWNEGNVDADIIEKELTEFVKSYYNVYKTDKIPYLAKPVAMTGLYVMDSLVEGRHKGDKFIGFNDIFQISKIDVMSIVKSVLYDMHSYAYSLGKYGEYNITIGDYLKCKPKEKPKLLEILGPKYLENIVKMRKTVDEYIKNLEKIIKKHEYEKYYKSDLNIDSEQRNKAVQSIHKAISFLYNLNYHLFMELINIRSAVAKAIKIGCSGNGYKKYLNNLQIRPKIELIKTNVDNYKLEDLDLDVNSTEKRIEIRGICYNDYQYSRVNQVLSTMSNMMNGGLGFNQRIIDQFKIMRELFKINDNCTLQLSKYSIDSDKLSVYIDLTKEVEKAIVEDDISFYHTTKNFTLKELTPSHCNDTMRILFEYPKIFIGYGSPLYRSGRAIFNTDSKYVSKNKLRIFEISSRELLLNDLRSNRARIVMDYDITGASNSVSIICFEGQKYPVKDVTDIFLNQE